MIACGANVRGALAHSKPNAMYSVVTSSLGRYLLTGHNICCEVVLIRATKYRAGSEQPQQCQVYNEGDPIREMSLPLIHPKVPVASRELRQRQHVLAKTCHERSGWLTQNYRTLSLVMQIGHRMALSISSTIYFSVTDAAPNVRSSGKTWYTPIIACLACASTTTGVQMFHLNKLPRA